jgi:hypothetical protein
VGSVVLVADETVAARRDVVYGLFGARMGAGWVFAAEWNTPATRFHELTRSVSISHGEMRCQWMW